MRVNAVLAALALSTSALLVGWILWLCGAGIDFTDEGLYLHWVANPWYYPTSLTQFGFVYHPLYEIASGHLVRLRQLNTLLSVGLGWLLGYALLRVGREPGGGREGRAMDAVSSAVLGTTVLVQLMVWLPTPNYNTLALQGLLLACAGLAWSRSAALSTSFAGWALTGLGGAVVFLAKPSTAAVLAVLALLHMALGGAARWKGAVLSAVIAAMVLLGTAMVTDGSPAGFIDRIALSMVDAKLLTPEYNLAQALRFDDFYFSPQEKRALVGMAAALAFLALLASSPWRSAQAVVALAALGLATVTALAVLHPPLGNWQLHRFRGLWMWGITGAGALAMLVFWLRQRTEGLLVPLATAAWLMLIPAAYVFGTNNNYWATAGLAACFWAFAAAAALAQVAPRAPGAILLVALGAQAVTAGLLGVSAQLPYRQLSPLAAQDSTVSVHGVGDDIRTDPDTARYVRSLQAGAREAGMPAGATLVDLTGRTPLAAYLLQAKAPGQAWLLGGYPGSQNYAKSALDKVPCEVLAGAWVLTQPGSRGSLPANVLEPSGIVLARDYADALRITPPPTVEQSPPAQVLSKPLRSADQARQACEQGRSTRG